MPTRAPSTTIAKRVPKIIVKNPDIPGLERKELEEEAMLVPRSDGICIPMMAV
jgi:hypothetical protein